MGLISELKEKARKKLFNIPEPIPTEVTYITLIQKKSEQHTEVNAWNVAIIYRHPYRKEPYVLCRKCHHTGDKRSAILDSIYMAMDSLGIMSNPTKTLVLVVYDNDVRNYMLGKESKLSEELLDRAGLIKELLTNYPGNILFTKYAPYPEDIQRAEMSLVGL